MGKSSIIQLEIDMIGFMRAHNLKHEPNPGTVAHRIWEHLEKARLQMLSEIRQAEIRERNLDLFIEQ